MPSSIRKKASEFQERQPLFIQLAGGTDISHTVFSNFTRFSFGKKDRYFIAGYRFGFRRSNTERLGVKIKIKFSRRSNFVKTGIEGEFIYKVDMFRAAVSVLSELPPTLNSHRVPDIILIEGRIPNAALRNIRNGQSKLRPLNVTTD